MREAVGGSVLIQIVMIFIVLYAALLAIAINYSIAFRVKNNIINLIEEYGEVNDEAIRNYVNSVGYYKGGDGHTEIDSNCTNGYCIEKIPACLDAADTSFRCRGSYYKVTTYIAFDFPIIGNLLRFKVTGETRVIN